MRGAMHQGARSLKKLHQMAHEPNPERALGKASLFLGTGSTSEPTDVVRGYAGECLLWVESPEASGRGLWPVLVYDGACERNWES